MSSSILVVISVGLLIVGCANPQRKADSRKGFVVDSISDQSLVSKRKRFELLPARKDISRGDLYFREYAAYVGRALKKIGYTQVSNAEQAEIVVLLDWGTGDPNTTVVTHTNASASSYPSGLYATSSSATYADTTYAKYLVVKAVDKRTYSTSSPVAIWQTTVTSRGFDRDLRLEMPLLVTCGLQWFGKDTSRQVYDSIAFTPRHPDYRLITGNSKPIDVQEGDITFSSLLCKNPFTKEVYCGAKIKGLKPLKDNSILLKVTLENESVIAWKKPVVVADCSYKKYLNSATGSGVGEAAVVSVGADKIELPIELKPKDKIDRDLVFNLSKLKIPEGKDIKCDVYVKSATEFLL